MRIGLLLLIILMVSLNAFGQKNTLTIGTFIPPLSTIIGVYEHRLPFAKNRIGIGVMGLYRNPPRVNAKEFSIGPRANYFFVDKKAGNIYAGIGGATGTLNNEQKWDFRIQAGINAKIVKDISFKLEYSNYMFIDNGLGIMGGLNYSF